MNKMEKEIVFPRKPKFYKRYVDNTYIRRKKCKKDKLFKALNSFYPNVKLKIGANK